MVLVGLRYDLWLSFIGVFVVRGSRWRAAGRRGPDGRRGRSRVADLMVHDPTTLEVSFPLSAVAPFLQASPGRVLPVVDRGTVRRPHRRRLGCPDLPAPALVGDATDRDAPTLSAGDPVYPGAVECLPLAGAAPAAVLDDNRVVGVLYAAHLEAALRRATARTARSLERPALNGGTARKAAPPPARARR